MQKILICQIKCRNLQHNNNSDMKKIFLLVVAACLLFGIRAMSQGRKLNVYGIGFYNLENLFDTCHAEGKNDYE